jgi:hypothetical protein
MPHDKIHGNADHSDAPAAHTHSHDTELTGVSADDHHAQSHAHSSHTGITATDHHSNANDHAASHVLATGTALGADHTISGAAVGEVLRALTATTAAFDVLAHADLGSVTADQHHAQLHATAHQPGGGDAMAVDAAAATGSLRTLGAGAAQAAAGDHTHGASGAPSDADYLVGTAHAGLSAEIVVGTSPGGELGGTWAAPTVDATHSGSTHQAATTTHEAAADPHTGYRLESADHFHSSSGLQAGQVSHFDLINIGANDHHAQSHTHASHTSIGANDHHAQSHVLADGAGLGADHTVSGAVAGEVLRARSATTAAFDSLEHNDLIFVTANQHHAQSHGNTDHTDVFVYKDVDESVANSTALQQDNELFFAFGAFAVWEFTFFIMYSSASATPDLKLTIEDQSGLGTVLWHDLLGTNNPTTAGQIRRVGGDVSVWPADASIRIGEIRGIILGSSTGSALRLKWAQNASNATATILRTGSYLVAHKIA